MSELDTIEEHTELPNEEWFRNMKIPLRNRAKTVRIFNSEITKKQYSPIRFEVQADINHFFLALDLDKKILVT
jgi:hypothetical protein